MRKSVSEDDKVWVSKNVSVSECVCVCNCM